MPINSFDDYPMSWKPQVDKKAKSIYLGLAKQLEADICTGVLQPGVKLPPQRELADFLEINLSTVTRAFKLCEQKGLICATIGSGTFVAADAHANMILTPNSSASIIEMGSIFPQTGFGEEISQQLKLLLKQPDFGKLFHYGRVEGTALQRSAASKLLHRVGCSCEPAQLLFAGGGQNAIMTVLASLFQAGDKIGTDPVTYPGIKTAAKMLGIKLVPVKQKNGEMSAKGLEEVCKTEKIKCLYLIPDFHNPTTHTMSLATRQKIAGIAKRENLLVLEDAIHSLLRVQSVPPLYSLAPEQVVYFLSLSKTISPGLRLAFVVPPEKYKQKLSAALYNMSLCLPPLMPELAAQLINNGAINSILARGRQLTQLFNRLVEQELAGYQVYGSQQSIFRWLVLPEGMNSSVFEAQAFKAGVQVYAAERFAVGNSKAPQAVRLAVVAPGSVDKLRAGLTILKKLLANKETEILF